MRPGSGCDGQPTNRKGSTIRRSSVDLETAYGRRLKDGSCIRLRPEYSSHVWGCDFVEDRTHDGRNFRTLIVIDEFTRECLAIRVSRKLKAVM